MTKHTRNQRIYIPKICNKTQCVRGSLCQNFSPISNPKAISFPSCSYFEIEYENKNLPKWAQNT